MSQERYREILENKIAMEGGLRVGGCEGAGKYRTCVGKYTDGPKKGKCARYKVHGKSPKQSAPKEGTKAQRQAGKCNPWAMFMKDYCAATGLTLSQVLKDAGNLRDAKKEYAKYEDDYRAMANQCRRKYGLEPLRG
jgi:hypothetical protein